MTDDTRIEILKSLRSQWLTVEQMAFEFGAAVPCIRRWLRAAQANGVVASRLRQKPEGKNGVAPAEFAVTRDWGGVA